MAGVIKLLTFAVIVMIIVVTKANYQKCDENVIKCIKKVNKDYYLGGPVAAFKLVTNKDYLITYYSANLIKGSNLTCISTEFTLKGNKDSYHNSCTEKQQEITFKTSFNFLGGNFLIKEYQNQAFSGYPLYYGTCIALYVCSEIPGVKDYHITVYCPAKEKNSDKVKAEIQKAIVLFSKCHINNGAWLCQDDCYWY